MNDFDQYFELLITKAKTLNNPFVAVVVVVAPKTHKVLSEGTYSPGADISAHSEIVAIRQFLERYPDGDRSEFIVCTTAEPCPMCSSALVYAGFQTVIYGISRPALFTLGWTEFQMRTQDIFNDAKRSNGFLGNIEQYTGSFQKDCIGLFNNRS